MPHESFVRSTRVKVCKRFGERPTLLRPWFLRYIKKGGHEIDIDYIDTLPNADGDSVPTIVMLHGTPGSYYDFFKFIAAFGSSCRIIAPNFPNFSYTLDTGCFWHSAEEKSEFIVDFLRHINVTTVDCLVAHSMAAYAASYLWIYANWDTYFKLGSICLLSPVGMYKFSRKDRLRYSLITNMCRSLALRQLIPKSLFTTRNKMLPRSGSVLSNFEMKAWKTLTLYLSNYSNYHFRLKALTLSKIPTLFTFSSNDKLYSPNVFFDQLFELEAQIEDFDIYEQYENELIQVSTNQSWLKVVDFRSAGHYMFNTHPDVIHLYIDELLHRANLAKADHQKLIEQAS